MEILRFLRNSPSQFAFFTGVDPRTWILPQDEKRTVMQYLLGEKKAGGSSLSKWRQVIQPQSLLDLILKISCISGPQTGPTLKTDRRGSG
jgi:hypothetical protein